MNEVRVGVRELKNKLSEYLGQVKRGNMVVITEHGKPVGRILPINRPLEDRIRTLIQSGFMAWSGKKLEPIEPVARVRGNKTVADILIEDRE